MANRHRGSDEERTALDAWVKLARAASTVGVRAHGWVARERGLTETQFAVLEALYHCGAMTHTQLSGRILMSGSNVTTVVDNLERKGWVCRERDARDRRVAVVGLTPEGRALIEEIFPEHARGVAEIFAVLSAEEQRELARLCRKLGCSAVE